MAERRFAPVSTYAGKVNLPARKTALSAGYDLESAEEVRVEPGQVTLVPTGLKAYMAEGDVLLLAIRSSLAVKRQIMLANAVGVIDADYVDNVENEGHILVALVNLGREPVLIRKGERVAQAIFTRYLITGDDVPGGVRVGGIGSTGRE